MISLHTIKKKVSLTAIKDENSIPSSNRRLTGTESQKFQPPHTRPTYIHQTLKWYKPYFTIVTKFLFFPYTWDSTTNPPRCLLDNKNYLRLINILVDKISLCHLIIILTHQLTLHTKGKQISDYLSFFMLFLQCILVFVRFGFIEISDSLAFLISSIILRSTNNSNSKSKRNNYLTNI